jgi:tetratricopeptide (TPR) repeat protein
MMRSGTILLLGMALLVRADESADELTAQGIAEFTAAYEAWDGDRFGAAAQLFRQAAALAPNVGTHAYWLGVAEFHRMLQLRNPPPTRPSQGSAASAMEAATDALTRAVELEVRDAESHAMLGTIYGLRIDGNLFRALRLGPRVQKHRVQALRYGAENPRVRYLLGVCLFHTARKPAEYREALESLQVAERLFEEEAGRVAGPGEPRWGHSSCLTFIGRTHESLGQLAEAAEYFRKALALQSSNHVAAEGLARVTTAP